MSAVLFSRMRLTKRAQAVSNPSVQCGTKTSAVLRSSSGNKNLQRVEFVNKLNLETPNSRRDTTSVSSVLAGLVITCPQSVIYLESELQEEESVRYSHTKGGSLVENMGLSPCSEEGEEEEAPNTPGLNKRINRVRDSDMVF